MRMQSRRLGSMVVAAIACAIGPMQALSAPAQTPGTIPPVADQWTWQKAFADDKEAENISGLACASPSGSTRACLLVSDEVLYARLLDLSGTVLHLGAPVALLPKKLDGDKIKETDAEGADFEDGYYYAIGSHGASKQKGEYRPERFFVYRFPVDPASGQPTFPMPEAGPAPQVERSSALEGIIAGVPLLKDKACTGAAAACVPLQDGGVNVEGMAVRDKQLYVGFRAPVIDGEAVVLRVALDAVFGKAEPKPEVFRLKLGKDTGIRDLTKIKGGFLVLTGPERPEKKNDEVGGATVFFWGGGSEPAVPLGALGGMVAGAKPEAMLDLGDEAGATRVLVMSDGPAGGRPTAYRIVTPP